MKRYLVLAIALALAACAKPPQGESAAAAPAATATAEPAAAAPADASALPAYHWRLSDAKNAQGQRIEALFANAEKPLNSTSGDGRIGVKHLATAWAVRIRWKATS